MATEVYKAIVIGPASVGKSSLVRRYLEDIFTETYTATIGAQLKAANMNFPDGTVVLSIVDLGGQESFELLRSQFYQGAHYVMLVYDPTERETFDAIIEWYEGLALSFCERSENPVNGALVANKSDKESFFEVDPQEGRQLAQVLCLDFYQTSAKTGENVGELFINAAIKSRMSFAKANSF
ncbi:MAG: Rab family GTPase [Candidatus Thorarchaeota archaeon]